MDLCFLFREILLKYIFVFTTKSIFLKLLTNLKIRVTCVSMKCVLLINNNNQQESITKNVVYGIHNSFNKYIKISIIKQ